MTSPSDDFPVLLISAIWVLGWVAYTNWETKWRAVWVDAWYRATTRCGHGYLGGRSWRKCSECDRESADEATRQSQIAAAIEAARVEQLARESAEYERRRNAHNYNLGERRRWENQVVIDLDILRAISPRAFEDRVALLFQKLSYEVTQTPASNDGGYDALAVKDGVPFLIECKRYGERTSVGRPDLQKLVGAMSGRASHGIFVTTGRFSQGARDYAQGKNLWLIDGPELIRLLTAYEPKAAETVFYQKCKKCLADVRFDTKEAISVATCSCGLQVPGPGVAETETYGVKAGPQVTRRRSRQRRGH